MAGEAPREPPGRALLLGAAGTFIGVLVTGLAEVIRPSGIPDWVPYPLDQAWVLGPVLGAAGLVVLIAWRKPDLPGAAAVGLGAMIALAGVPGVIITIREEERAYERLTVDVGIRRVAGKAGPQMSFGRSVRASPGDTLEVQVRVGVFDKLPDPEANVRLWIAKSPVSDPAKGDELTRGVRADVLERAGEWGNGETASITSSVPIRIVPAERPEKVAFRMWTEQGGAPAPPWTSERVVTGSLTEDLDSFIGGPGDNALDEITSLSAAELLVFRLKVEAG